MTLRSSALRIPPYARWVTLGRAENGRLLVVVHTTEEISATELHVRIISGGGNRGAEIGNRGQTTVLFNS